MNSIKSLPFFFLSAFLVFAQYAKAQELRIIPQPVFMQATEGAYTFSNLLFYNSPEGLSSTEDYLRIQLMKYFGITLKRSPGPHTGIQVLVDTIKYAHLGREGYELNVNGNGLTILAANPAGIFYGTQTLLQLIKREAAANSFRVPFVAIRDKPRFSWRSFLLDEARCFRGMETVKGLLDEMAALKFNRFHWHLTDDQGWRIEIKKYPRLTSIGGRYEHLQDSMKNTGRAREKGYYYTQEQIKEIVAYAAQRFITVFPEIEMPGHASAAIAAYPWLGTSGKQIKIPVNVEVFYNVFNIADPKVVSALQEILSEVMKLFPSKIVHIGGDEVKFDQWKSSPGVQSFMKKESLTSPADLQIWFTNLVSNFIYSKGGRMIGWNDILGEKLHEYNDTADSKLTTTLSPSAIIQFWKGDSSLINKAVKAGHEVINSYHEYTYLDYSYERTSLEKAYSFEPLPGSIDVMNADKIIGIGCQMWGGERFSDKIAMERQIYPRIAAYAECGWSFPKEKSFNAFLHALLQLQKRWKKNDIQPGLETGR